MLVAVSELEIPLVSIGDIIRVHRVVFKGHRSHKTSEVFLDGGYDQRVSIRIWDCSAFAVEVDPEDQLAIHEKTRDAAEPYWSSKHPTVHAIDRIEWKNEEHKPLREYDWNCIRKYAAWVHESLTSHRMSTQYTIQLEQWIDSDRTFADILVRVIDVEDIEPENANELFNTQDSSYQSQLPANKFVAYVGNLNKISERRGVTSFRVRVVDSSCMNDGSIWVLTNFQFYTVAQLRGLRQGDLLRVRNAEYKGLHPLRRPTKFLHGSQNEGEFGFVDCYLSRVIRLPSFSSIV